MSTFLRSQTHEATQQWPSAGQPCQNCTCLGPNATHPIRCFEFDHIAPLSIKTRFKAKATIAEEGDPALHYFIVTRGMMKLSKSLPDGRKQIIRFSREGDFIGLTLGETYGFSIEAITPVELCKFDRVRIEFLTQGSSSLENSLRRVATCELSMAQNQMLLLGRKLAKERVASFLLQLSDQAMVRGESGELLLLPMTRADIADYLGLTIETICRTLSALKASGAIEWEDISLVRIDRTKLKTETGELCQI
jgi:CRP/FNR family transcriptional regulator